MRCVWKSESFSTCNNDVASKSSLDYQKMHYGSFPRFLPLNHDFSIMDLFHPLSQTCTSIPLFWQYYSPITMSSSHIFFNASRLSQRRYLNTPPVRWSAAILPRAATAPFSSSPVFAATPAGPPPQGYRLPRKERWDEGKESSLDKAGHYFLMGEMLRGMYVVLEQFFRPP